MPEGSHVRVVLCGSQSPAYQDGGRCVHVVAVAVTPVARPLPGIPGIPVRSSVHASAAAGTRKRLVAADAYRDIRAVHGRWRGIKFDRDCAVSLVIGE